MGKHASVATYLKSNIDETFELTFEQLDKIIGGLLFSRPTAHGAVGEQRQLGLAIG